MIETEQDFMQAVIDLAHTYGWKVAHFRPARTGKGWRTPVQAEGEGFPDLILCRPPRLIIAEVKSENGKLTEKQAQWIYGLGFCTGVEAELWYPADWEHIVKLLERTELR